MCMIYEYDDGTVMCMIIVNLYCKSKVLIFVDWYSTEMEIGLVSLSYGFWMCNFSPNECFSICWSMGLNFPLPLISIRKKDGVTCHLLMFLTGTHVLEWDLERWIMFVLCPIFWFVISDCPTFCEGGLVVVKLRNGGTTFEIDFFGWWFWVWWFIIWW